MPAKSSRNSNAGFSLSVNLTKSGMRGNSLSTRYPAIVHVIKLFSRSLIPSPLLRFLRIPSVFFVIFFLLVTRFLLLVLFAFISSSSCLDSDLNLDFKNESIFTRLTSIFFILSAKLLFVLVPRYSH